MKRTIAHVRVAKTLMEDPDGQHWGYETARKAGVRSGILYPMFQRWLDAGLLTDGWEDAAEAHRQNRPARRYYTLTELGRLELAMMASR